MGRLAEEPPTSSIGDTSLGARVRELAGRILSAVTPDLQSKS